MQQHVASVETLGAAGAVSQIVATNVHPVIAGSFAFVPKSKAGNEVQDMLSEHRSSPVCVEDKLDLLADLRSAADTVAQAKQMFIDAVLSSVHHKLEAYDDDISVLSSYASELEQDVRNAALSLGGSIKGNKMQAVWAKGRVSWDSKGLEGVAVVMPEILKFRKVGEPSVSIRPVGGAR